MAAREGQAYVVQLLLTAGANKEAADKVILMILFCIAFIGQREVLNYLSILLFETSMVGMDRWT